MDEAPTASNNLLHRFLFISESAGRLVEQCMKCLVRICASRSSRVPASYPSLNLAL
ncbi:hypothetical protein K523DRAFT_84460 [Schizophyllum commune Tattone D]|nr:hypothetical protein K523DRAFT_84460 [Schizophyllum commune Tattone D]